MLTSAEVRGKWVLSVEDWGEIRRLHRAERMPVKVIARVVGCSKNTVKKAFIRHNTEVAGAEGDTQLEALVLLDNTTGITESVHASALFVLVGAEPHTHWLPASIQRDVAAGSDLRPADPLDGWPLQRPPLPLETSLPGGGNGPVGKCWRNSVNSISSASWKSTSWSRKTRRPPLVLAASHRTVPLEQAGRTWRLRAASRTVNSPTRYQRTGPTGRTLRRARSTTPGRPASAAVTMKAANPTPRNPSTMPCNGRPNDKISESTIGGIAAVTKYAEADQHERDDRMACDTATRR